MVFFCKNTVAWKFLDLNELFFYWKRHGIGRWDCRPGPRCRCTGSQHSELISVVESVMRGCDFMCVKGYFTSNLVHRSCNGWLEKERVARKERLVALLGPHGKLAGAGRGRCSGEWISTWSSGKRRGGHGDPYRGLLELGEATWRAGDVLLLLHLKASGGAPWWFSDRSKGWNGVAALRCRSLNKWRSSGSG
jgi:hypothetical protein